LLVSSRPVYLPYAQHFNISNNRFRGGGMSVENSVSSASDVLNSTRIVSENDCDTAISVGNGSIITQNIIDLANAPAGRGQQVNFYQAIESSCDNVIIGNIIRNHTNGIGAFLKNCIVSGNQFYNCGQTGAVGLGGIINYQDAFDADEKIPSQIVNNVFYNSGIPEIDFFSGNVGCHHKRNLIISGNSSYNCKSYFLLLGYVRDSVIMNNLGVDCCVENDTIQAFAVWEIGDGANFYEGNMIINTLADGHGIYQAISARPESIIGTNVIRGERKPKLLC
jgi:hypothetical protein